MPTGLDTPSGPSAPPSAAARSGTRPGLLAALLALGFAAWGGLPLANSPWAALAALSAWAGAGALLASLLLMLREPRLARRLGGLDAMYRWHHRCGLLAYVLLLIHPLALAASIWPGGGGSALQARQVLTPWGQGAAVLGGWLGLLMLMAGLAATFSPRLHYRRWRALHALLGLGVVAGLLHARALAAPGPGLALLLPALALLAWRLAVVDRGANAWPYRVAAVQPRAAGVIEARLEPLVGPLAGALAPQPGQFVLARFISSEGYSACGEFHPFTVSAIAPDGALSVTIKALGHCSGRLQQIVPGVLLRLQGPFGSFLAKPPADAAGPQLWVAGGIGITPFMARLRSGPCEQPTTLIYLYRSARDAAFLDELRGLAESDPRLRLLTRETGDEAPLLAPLLDSVGGALNGWEIHVCGPPGLVQGLAPLLIERGAAAGALHHESFDFR